MRLNWIFATLWVVTAGELGYHIVEHGESPGLYYVDEGSVEFVHQPLHGGGLGNRDAGYISTQRGEAQRLELGTGQGASNLNVQLLNFSDVAHVEVEVGALL